MNKTLSTIMKFEIKDITLGGALEPFKNAPVVKELLSRECPMGNVPAIVEELEKSGDVSRDFGLNYPEPYGFDKIVYKSRSDGSGITFIPEDSMVALLATVNTVGTVVVSVNIEVSVDDNDSIESVECGGGIKLLTDDCYIIYSGDNELNDIYTPDDAFKQAVRDLLNPNDPEAVMRVLMSPVVTARAVSNYPIHTEWHEGTLHVYMFIEGVLRCFIQVNREPLEVYDKPPLVTVMTDVRWSFVRELLSIKKYFWHYCPYADKEDARSWVRKNWPGWEDVFVK